MYLPTPAAVDILTVGDLQPDHQKKDFLYTLLEQVETRDAVARFEAARKLSYIAQGTPMYSSSPEDQMCLIRQNCSLLRSVGALQIVYDALRTAGGRWTIVSFVIVCS